MLKYRVSSKFLRLFGLCGINYIDSIMIIFFKNFDRILETPINFTFILEILEIDPKINK